MTTYSLQGSYNPDYIPSPGSYPDIERVDAETTHAFTRSLKSSGFFDETVTHFLQASRRSADKILGNLSDRGAVPIRTKKRKSRTYVNHSPTIISVGNSTHVHGQGSRDDGSGKAARALVGIIGTIVAFVGSYFIGKSISEIQNANKELDDVKEFKGYMEAKKTEHPNLYADVSKVRSLKGGIFSRIRNSAIAKLALTIALVAGAVLCVAGAFAASPALMVAGGVVALLSACGLLIRHGLASGSNANKEDAKTMMQKLDALDQTIDLSRETPTAPAY